MRGAGFTSAGKMSDRTDGWRRKQVISNEGLSKVVSTGMNFSAVILGLKVGHYAHVEIYAVFTCHVEKLLICQM